MKRALILLAAVGLPGFVVSRFTDNRTCKAPKVAVVNSKAKADSTVKGLAVVELFTSEGCSSCPTADALLEKLAAEGQNNVYVLSYHVDYWDRLGWKDVFAKPAWTARQSAYVRHFNLESAYTPQAVVNGSEEFVGSGSLQLHTSVDNGLHQNFTQPLRVSALNQGEKISISYNATASNDNVVNLALVQKSATSQVARGENSGRQLHHINIVKDLLELPATAEGEAHFSVPQNFVTGDYKIIAFLQNKNDLKIVGATEAVIQ